jgi:electron transport complex protein RnfE
MNQKQNFLKGLFRENQIFVVMLGMCSTLAITTSIENAIGMGLSVIFVLFFSNLIISLVKKIVPGDIRIAVYIVIIATLVGVVEMVMKAFLPALDERLGVFIALIAVNCIILGRAEAFASKYDAVSSMVDALGMGLGYTMALLLVSTFREFLGKGTITIWGDLMINLKGVYTFLQTAPSDFFVKPYGALLVLGFLIAAFNAIRAAIAHRKEEVTK